MSRREREALLEVAAAWALEAGRLHLAGRRAEEEIFAAAAAKLLREHQRQTTLARLRRDAWADLILGAMTLALVGWFIVNLFLAATA